MWGKKQPCNTGQKAHLESFSDRTTTRRPRPELTLPSQSCQCASDSLGPHPEGR